MQWWSGKVRKRWALCWNTAAAAWCPLPFPARTLFDFERYIRRWVYLPERGLRGATLITGRGCPFSCTFCQPTLRTLFGPVLRRRSPENVVEELRQLKKDHRIDAVFFHDDTFTLDQAWLQRFCTLATPLELLWGCNSRVDTLDSEAVAMMHSAGLRKVHLGIESIVPAVRNGLYKKGISNRQIRSALACLHERGIATLGFFMLGGPGESEAEQEATIDFACRSTLFEASFSLTTPFPGTVLHDLARNQALELHQDFTRYNYYASTGYRRPAEHHRLRRRQLGALLRFYSAPARLSYLFDHLRTREGAIDLTRKLLRHLT